MQAGSAIFGWCVFAGVLLWILAACRRKPDLMALLIAALAFRAGLALLHHYVAPLPDSQFDALAFQDWALSGSLRGLGGAVDHFTTGAYMYPSLISFLFLATGPNELIMQSLNVALGVAIVYLTYDIARLLFSHREGMFAGWVAALWPSLALYAAITMREAFVVIFLLLACRQLLYWRKRRHIRDAVLAGSFALCSMLFHTGMALLVLGIALVLSLALMRGFIRLPRSLQVLKFGPLVLVGVVALVVVLRTGAG
ncbi:MAG: ArnT family glycosyltransferase, partial [Alphaproteobacteria bacterium]